MTALFSVTLFTSAVLLFWVQLMVGKILLPLLGGSPAVWNTCLFFFQGMLLAGYTYAHVSGRWLTVRQQTIAHLALLGIAALALPLGTPHLSPDQTHPVLWLLAYLLTAVGLPLFAVSSTAPLMQRWFTVAHPKAGDDPYFLYAASNLGSMVGLLGYPLGLEPTLAIATQTQLWSWGYGGLLLCIAACALCTWVAPVPPSTSSPQSTAATLSADAPTLSQQLQWLVLSAVPASLLLGVTTYITTDLAAVPLLWAVPLLLYLLTFVLSFARTPILPYGLLVTVAPLLLTGLCLAFLLRIVQPMAVLLPLHLLGLFITAVVFHGKLAQRRPNPQYLTRFYLWIALGGALGGWLNAIAAPILFPTLLEYPLALAISGLLLFSPLFAPSQEIPSRPRWTLLLSLGVLLGGLLVGWGPVPASGWGIAIALLLWLLIGWIAQLRWVVIPGVLVLLLLNQFSVGLQTGLLTSDRSFFGVYRVVETSEQGRYHSLLHGTTLHGKQSLEPERRREPLTYFTRSGPVGQMFEALRHQSLERVGVLGLGVGTLAAYAQPEQQWTFYEIDPLAEALATNPAYFTFLQDTPAATRIVVGDGRLAIAQAPDQHYDLLFMDAFSSDSIPLHLVTQEAIQLYFDKLKPEGWLVINITNRFLDLEPILGAIAQSLNLVGLAQQDQSVTPAERALGKAPSHWVVLARQPEPFESLSSDARWNPLIADPQTPVWTDDYSNLLQAVWLNLGRGDR